MALARRVGSACAVAAALLAGSTAPAWAGAANHISILSPDGDVHRHALPRAARATLPAPPRHARVRHHAHLSRQHTVTGELARMARKGEITQEQRADLRRTYNDARRAARKLTGTRHRELQSVIDIMQGIAARGDLTPSRLAPLWLTLERNEEWWTTAPWVPAPSERVGFTEDDLVWQYYPGYGLQIQWLGTFGKLNWLAKGKSRSRREQANALIDQTLPLASRRAGGIAWEYEFPFGGGAPPWTSSLSQGTALQALMRAAVQNGRAEEVAHATRKGLSIFRRRTPEGVRVKVPGGVHFAQYSFAPGLRIINGFVQSVVGLHDYAEWSGNKRAHKLFETGLREVERELPDFDTGAWSLYSRGTSTHESDLNYHVLLRDFLDNLCERTDVRIVCRTAQRFTDDLTAPPKVRVPYQRLRRGRYGYVKIRLDKISSLTLRITRGKKVVESRVVGTLSGGTHHLGWSVPHRRGRYHVTITARDLAGNEGGGEGTVRVVSRRHG